MEPQNPTPAAPLGKSITSKEAYDIAMDIAKASRQRLTEARAGDALLDACDDCAEKDKLICTLEEQNVIMREALENAEYEVSMGKGILDELLTPDMKNALGYCGDGECGQCPMCRLNSGLNVLKFERIRSLPTS